MNDHGLTLPLSLTTPGKQHQSLKAMKTAVKDMQARLAAPRLQHAWEEDGIPLQGSAGWRRRTIGAGYNGLRGGDRDETDLTEYRRGRIRETIRRDWDDESPSPPRPSITPRKRFLHSGSLALDPSPLQGSVVKERESDFPPPLERELDVKPAAGAAAASILSECRLLFGLVDDVRRDLEAASVRDNVCLGKTEMATHTSELEEQEQQDRGAMLQSYQQLLALVEHHDEQLAELQHAENNFLNHIAQLQQRVETEQARLAQAQGAVKTLTGLLEETCEEVQDGLAIAQRLFKDVGAELQPAALFLCSTIQEAQSVLTDMEEEQEELEVTASRGLEMISFARRIHAQRLQSLSRMFCSWLAETRKIHARNLPFERLIRLPDIEIVHTSAATRHSQEQSEL